MLKVSVSGIRGIVGESLTPEVALRFSAAFGNILGGGAVVVGRDTRPSGEGLTAAVVSGLLATGCDVTDIGIAPTPTVLFARKSLGATGAVVVTASHNPEEWNALKIVGPDGLFLHGDLSEQLLERYSNGEITWNSWEGAGVYSEVDGISRHLESILSLPVIDADRIKDRGYRVVIDCVNGAGSEAASKLLSSLGCEVTGINCGMSGDFTRGPEPVAENLGELEKEVVKQKADIGFALDPDADRLSIVDETGSAIGEEMTLPLVIDLILEKEPGPVVVNLSTSLVCEEVAGAHGVKCFRAPVGEANVALLMRGRGAVIGGEGNGGVMYPGLHTARDGILGMALVLQHMAEKEKTIGEVVKAYPAYHIIKRKVEVKDGSTGDILRELESHAFGNVNRDDGLRISGGGKWVHLRPSNTEPVLRIIAEARSPEEALGLATEFEEIIIELLE